MQRLLVHAIAKCLNGSGQLRLIRSIAHGWAPCIWEHDGRTKGGAILIGLSTNRQLELAFRLTGHLICLHKAEVLRAANISLVDHMIVTTDSVFLLRSIKSKCREINVSRSNQCQRRLFLLVALKLGMHHIEFEQFRAVQDVVHIFFA